jgi:hypothetical protein
MASSPTLQYSWLMLILKVKFQVIMYLIYLMGPPMKLGMTLEENYAIESKPDNKVEDL